MGFLDFVRRRGGALRSSGLPGEPSFGSMSRDELQAWENADAPSVARASDAAEAETDEKQDATTSLNFPLHWTSTRESWDFLFDAAIACELLAPRPDDRVLDFAAGTGWATEMLTRIGVRSVSIDLSLEMMRRGRQRLAADSRLVFREDAAFVVARGQMLPFGDGVFDGVLCLNALHHLPSYAAALAEIFRVLKPGGRAVFSEPGTAHAVAPLSAFRMREHAVLEKRVSLPLVRRLALDAGFSRMRVVPLRSSGMHLRLHGVAGRRLPRSSGWDDTLRLSPGEHSRFVLHKGDDRRSTRSCRQKLFGRLGARITVESTASRVAAGQPFSDRVRIANTGSVTWRAHGRRFGGQVTCGLKVQAATATRCAGSRPHAAAARRRPGRRRSRWR